MSNLWFNIRIWRIFIQSSPDRRLKISRAYEGAKYKTPLGIYCLFGKHF